MTAMFDCDGFTNAVRSSSEPRSPRRIGYGRVSTADQSTEQQRHVLLDAGCSAVFVEKVSSCVDAAKRQQLMACLEALERGDVLVVAKLDRLGRTQSEVIARLASLSDAGIHLETLDGLLNTRAVGRMAPLVIGLLTGLAEVERSLIRERTRESVEFRRRTGGNLGGRPQIPEAKRDLARRLRAEGQSMRAIASALDLSVSTVHRYASEQPCEQQLPHLGE